MEDIPNEVFEILCCNEVWRDENDESLFDHRIVVLRHGEEYFFARDPRRNGDIVPTQLSLEQIPITHIRAPFAANMTIAPDWLLNLEDIYIKEPRLHWYGNCSAADQKTFFGPQLQEVQVYEQLRQSPHPNIGTYHGCVVKDGRIKGLCLRRYDRTLEEMVQEESLSHKQKKAYIEDVERGIKHLHSLGLVHGDVNPSNIMVDRSCDRAVLIDFDSCRPVGERMGLKAGTEDWTLVGFPEFAELKHDLTSLRLLEKHFLSDS